MKTKKKNRFLSFCFSLLPGAAEMYMGFMKTGVSLMLLFFLVIMLSVWLNQGAIGMVGVVVWFYGFFHANHLAGLSDEDFAQVKDDYILGMEGIPGIRSIVNKYDKWVAGILIFLGICFLWNSMEDLLRAVLPEMCQFIPRMMWRIGNYVPSMVIGVGIIVVGIKMLKGKESALPENSENKTQDQEP
ncbi:MAG: hypothetical protein NC429_12685 [Lachnospiraceae bacterium]|nr:hypothetical protein [Lachnospiraceae bacterium]